MKTNRTVTICVSFFLAFSMLAPAHLYSQQQVAHKPGDAEKAMLCHKWNFGNANDFTGLFPSSLSTIQFMSDGYVEFVAGKQIEGVWNYDELRQYLFIIVNNKLFRFNVLSLTKQQLVLENRQPSKAVKDVLWRDNM